MSPLRQGQAPLTSAVLTSPADPMLSEAIETTLRAAPHERGELFSRLLHDIADFISRHPKERPWKFEQHTGTDGSFIFRGGTGRAIVIDASGAMWRARSYEDFDFTYEIANNECRIVSVTPRYEEMRRYQLESP
jgi:hypothetical protein